MTVFPYVPREDRAHIENKYHKVGQPFDSRKRWGYHGYAFDETTGLSDEEIREGLRQLAARMEGQPHAIIKAEAVAFVLDHTRIDVNEHDWFVGMWSWGRLPDEVTVKPWDNAVTEQAAKRFG